MAFVPPPHAASVPLEGLNPANIPAGVLADRYAPYFIVGNEPNGDTLLNCHYLDTGNCAGIAAAVAAANAANVDVWIRPGIYNFNLPGAPAGPISISGSRGVRVRGSGAGTTSILARTTGEQGVFILAAARAELSDVLITAGNLTGDGTFGSSALVTSLGHVSRVNIACGVVGVFTPGISACIVSTATGTVDGCDIESAYAGLAGYLIGGATILSGSRALASFGVIISDSGALIDGCTFGGSVTCIRVNNAALTTSRISGCVLTPGVAGKGLHVINSANVHASGVSIATAALQAGAIGVHIENSSRCSFNAGVVYNQGVGLRIDAASSRCIGVGNDLSTCTTPLDNLSATSELGHNVIS